MNTARLPAKFQIALFLIKAMEFFYAAVREVDAKYLRKMNVLKLNSE